MKFTYAPGDKPVPGYTIRRGLGRGGFGEVYLAVSQRGKEVALKLVQRHLDVELRGVGQCLNLKHAHLVVVYDILKVENDDYWIVMEYVAGESLSDVLARHPQGMPEQDALVWLRGICAGVSYLHDHGIAHRDLKPGNLFIEKGVVKIGDYGLSKFISATQRSGHTESVGTVYYMAPEVSRGRYGKEVDQYALGVILYQMLTGELPFDGESPGEILMKHLVGEPDLTRLFEPYRSVVTRLLDKDPQRRFPSVGEMLNQLLDQIPNAPAAPEPAPAHSAPGTDPKEPADEEAAAENPREGSPSSSRKRNSFWNIFGWKDWAKCDQPTSEQPQEADLDRARLIQILVENGIQQAEEIAKVFQTLGEGPEHDWLARARAVRLLVENGKQVSDIIAFLSALRKRPGQDLSPKIQALQILLDHGIEDGDDISRVLRALDDRTGNELSGHVTAVQILVENGIESSEDIERIVEALGEEPAFDLSSKLTVLQVLVENGITDSEDITRILHALGKYPGQDPSVRIRAVQVLIEHGMSDSADIARVLNALARCPAPNLAGVVRAIESMVENSMDAEDIALVLRLLGECPEQDLASKVQAVRSMASEGRQAEDIERSLRTH
ncbi:MAG TPA: serine/threonine-protein kinase [Gemmataceae bacterium]|jgi:serine/threonine protein kinase